MKPRIDTNLLGFWKQYLLLIIVFIVASCATNKTCTIVGYDYDDKTDKTDYFVVPYGTVSIPGKWNKSNYNSSSRQQFFNNTDSVTISLSLDSCNEFEFNANKTITGFEFVKSYYEWDSQFFIENFGLINKLLEQDPEKNYIIWRLQGKFNDENIDKYIRHLS
ncbi:MAG: hypothetical protein K8S23_13065 [Candidatus Cloacimonetes bacterium]|nr:hypothetical protein [Candidatus Cloacimonadota bacterium]